MRKGVHDLKLGMSLNKKGGDCSTFFAPNLTMNLTYLCYGNNEFRFPMELIVKKTVKGHFHRRNTCLDG